MAGDPALTEAPRLEPSDRLPITPGTKFRDYILTEYPASELVHEGLHPASLLRHVLRREGLLPLVWPAIEALQRVLGSDETVWGVKFGAAGFGLELYFYNNDLNRGEHPKRATNLIKVLAPFVRVESQVDEALPYFMCSIELDGPTLTGQKPAFFRVYLGSGDLGRRECGFSYLVRGKELELENHYWFYQANVPEELQDVRRRLSFSPRAGGAGLAEPFLPDYLLDCHTICYAVKPACDGLYFSRVRTPQLARFLAQSLPGPLARLVAAHARDFASLRWDVGVDFRPAAAGGPPRARKTAVYGVV